jgi:hypothetical protein
MKLISGLILIAGICLFCLSTEIIFAADKTIYEELTAPAETETQWLWGEVVSVDLQKNELLVKYLDYETDQEKEVKINVDDKTIYENASSMLEIKPLDTVSIDYIISPDGSNLAGNISLEKLENEGVLEEAIPEEPGGIGNMEEQGVLPQEKTEEKSGIQESAAQETVPAEKLEIQEAVSQGPAEVEKSEAQEPVSEGINTENSMPAASAGQ